jgi:hypothetical protein
MREWKRRTHERRMAEDPVYREAWEARQKRKAGRAEERKAEREAAQAKRLARSSRVKLTPEEQAERAERAREKRRLYKRKLAAMKTPAYVRRKEQEKARHRERMATDPEYAARVNARARARYAANPSKKIAAQRRRRAQRAMNNLRNLIAQEPEKRPCKVCGGPVVGKSLQTKVCGEECRQENNRRLRRDRYGANSERELAKRRRPPRLSYCLVCDELISTQMGRTLEFCSARCRKSLQNEKERIFYNPLRGKSRYGLNPNCESVRAWRAELKQKVKAWIESRKRELVMLRASCPTCRRIVKKQFLTGDRPKYCSLKCGIEHAQVIKKVRLEKQCRQP